MEKTELTLKSSPTLSDYQKYISEMIDQRGFNKENVPQIFMLFLEECGELAKAGRKNLGLKSDNNSEHFNIAHEAADVFMYLLDICNHFDVDLEKAFREKEEINKKRHWE
jgi:NTP pyrophosphatase (non-canonical NTP hydrolase)